MIGVPLTGGDVLRLQQVDTYPAGCGVTVSRLAYLAGHRTHAIFPAPEISQYLRMIGLVGLPHDYVPVAGPIQTRFLITDSTGESTQFLDPAMPLDAIQLAQLRDLTVTRAEDAEWVVLGGPLPDVAPNGWYVEVIRALALYHPGVRTAVATSGGPLRALLRQLSAITPSVLALRNEDITDLLPGSTLAAVDVALRAGDLALLGPAICPMLEAGVSEVVVSCPPDTAVVFGTGSGYVARSTLRTAADGDRFREVLLAGYLMSDADDEREKVSSALAYATADESLHDDELPTPDLVDLGTVYGTRLSY
ncbi:1-phosphofructokinase family hexose kinase [Corynebacterium sp. CCM 9185]|uniref:1-phosphofructokinase family hexose kinase n=1 Tax=Corynebacterium marambiense TaxID=2765364 RepID=A0ABS0VV41_9CORY|nr:1-phosphofructokinase family hexose kinase [Corynebacterium marambiense]MBI9000639.1 1-phosphofructokinase family hexose kinase [Corynebacterium marambiense]MCK7663098.1 1-phosphofructokinase family hexose kinase [Corynebacterium marambiense]